MKRIITSVLLSFTTIAAMAQIADIEISYSAFSPNYKNGEVDVRHQYILLANSMSSKFYSPITEYIDSLNATPEGAAKWKEMTRAAYLSDKMDDIPCKDGNYYVVKSQADNTLRYYDSAGIDNYYYEETPGGMAWEISDSTKNILGHECIQASVDYHGRRWIAWFSPDIPISNGPWKLGELPGLILEASTDDGKYSFTATGLQQTTKTIGPVYLVDQYEKTTRKEMLKAQRAFLDNPIGNLSTQLGMTITVSGMADKDMFAPAEVVDLIETDYH